MSPMRRIPHSERPNFGRDHVDLHAAVRSALRRAVDRRNGVTSIDTAKRDRRARVAGTLDQVRKIEDRLLDLVEQERSA
jgi:hypothetical protein